MPEVDAMPEVDGMPEVDAMPEVDGMPEVEGPGEVTIGETVLCSCVYEGSGEDRPSAAPTEIGDDES